jgi:hypothetical protein
MSRLPGEALPGRARLRDVTDDAQLALIAEQDSLKQRVAGLEALVGRILHPVLVSSLPEMSEEDVARFKAEWEKAMAGRSAHELKPVPPSSLTVFTPE